MSSDEDSRGRKREKFTSEKTANKTPEKAVNEYEEASDNLTGYSVCDSYGPALPPHLISTSADKHKLNAASNESFGPRLPDNYRSFRENEYSEGNEGFGTQNPSGDGGRKVIGPEIPRHLLPTTTFDEQEEDVASEEVEAAVYGPSLSLMADGSTDTGTLNSSSFVSKRKGSPETVVKRESWMVDLPPERASSFGLGPRQFRARLPNEKDSDRSCWTDTPTDKGKGLSELEKAKKNDEKIITQKQIEERNKEMERLVKKIEKKKKRDKSLLEIHRKMMRKKEKKEARKREKEGTTTQRRPFDRNTDLQIQKFDFAQKNAVLKKAALLNDRFAQGKSKFL